MSISEVIAGARRSHIEVGDCIDVMRSMPDACVHAVIFSPPYFLMRDYKVTGQIGLERSVDEFVAKLVEVMHSVYRVLRPDGLCWLNLGDTFAQGGRGGIGERSTLGGSRNSQNASRAPAVASRVPGRPGDALGIPWRVLFALQTDGWLNRGEIVWEKSAPQPENMAGWRWQRHKKKKKNGERPGVGRAGASPGKPRLKHNHHVPMGAAEWDDCAGCARCAENDGFILRRGSWRATRSHEYVFLLSKTMGYYADELAAKEPVTGGTRARGNGVNPKCAKPGSKIKQNESFSAAVKDLVAERNLRTVWRTGPEPFDPKRLNLGADVEGVEHFATFVPSLIEPMIAISTPAGGVCADCGAPWARVLGGKLPAEGKGSGVAERAYPDPAEGHRGRIGHHNSFSVPWSPSVTETLGWKATCKCARGRGISVPAIVFDPFSGAGTTALVAERLGRRFIGVELNPDYARLGTRRREEDQPLFNRPRSTP